MRSTCLTGVRGVAITAETTADSVVILALNMMLSELPAGSNLTAALWRNDPGCPEMPSLIIAERPVAKIKPTTQPKPRNGQKHKIIER